MEIGRELKAHKEKKPNDVTWEDYVREHFDRKKQRADELIRLANGDTTLAKLWQDKRASVARTRAKQSTLQ